MNFDTQVKMALAQEGKALLRNQVDKSFMEHRATLAARQTMFRWAAAAVLVFALAAVWFVLAPGTSSPERLFSDNFKTLDAGTLRGNMPLNPIWERALTEYDHKNYTPAVQLFKEALEDPSFTEKDAANLYLGLSLLADYQPTAAFNAFWLVRKSSLLYPDAQWYAALAALASDNTAQAKLLLTAIAKDDSHHQQKRAKKMLTHLK